MPKISEMAAPASALSGLELIPILQGGGSDANAGLPLLATRSVPSGAVLILRKPMTADLSATTDADPGAGKVRWNNATPASATVLYIDDADTASGDIATPLATVQVGGFVYLQANSTSSRRDCWQKWQVTSLTDATGYTKIGVTYVAGAGTWTADETLELTVQQPTPASATVKQAQVMLSDMSTALTTGTGKALWIAPEAGSLTDVWIGVGTVSSSGAVTVDFNKNGTSVLTTQPSIDVSENTSLTGTSAVISSASFAKGDRFTFDIDAAGTGAKALMATVEYEPS
ncbi:MAG: hypothetical protein IT472_09495 [Thermomonas sp.]|uniref:hypothetical protein n=1 Tax=Thermomonas sp. TaxID=1971895 RepID=UPI00260DC022|nr:hypothetical protein [Thermomonas sp.]MCC7097397.1 hypothetical protein [Thermomonas sp.]